MIVEVVEVEVEVIIVEKKVISDNGSSMSRNRSAEEKVAEVVKVPHTQTHTSHTIIHIERGSDDEQHMIV